MSATVPGFGPRAATVDLTFPVDAAATEKVRWYREDDAGFPTEPGPTLAAEAERLLETLGRELFTAVFGSATPVTSGPWPRPRDWTNCGSRSTPTPPTCPTCPGSCCATRAARCWWWPPRRSSAPTIQELAREVAP
jgi:hypothetical protein